MRKFDREKLRIQLIEIFSAYAKDPTDFSMKKRARVLHTAFGNSGELIDKYMRHAVSMLVNVGWNLPEPPKPSKQSAERLVFALAARKA